MTREVIKMTGRGARGESFADIARRQGEIDGWPVAADATDDAAMEALVAAAGNRATTLVEAGGAFEAPIADDYLNAVVRKIEIYGAKKGHDYIVSLFKTGTDLFELRVKNLTENKIVATVDEASPVYDADFNLLRFNLLAMSGPDSTYTGYTGIVELDPTAIVPSAAVHQYTTFAEAGIRRSNIVTFDEVTNLFWNGSFNDIVPVPAGGATDDLMDAVRGLYEAPVTDELDILAFHWCPRATPRNPVVVQLEEGEYFATNLYVPDWVFIRGRGKAVVDDAGNWVSGTLIRKLNGNARPPLQTHLNSKLLDLSVFSDTSAELYSTGLFGQYAVHSDINNLLTAPDQVGSVNYQINQLVENVELLGGPDNEVQLWGHGLSTPGRVVHRNVSYRRLKNGVTQPFASSHTCSNENAYRGSLEFQSCAVLNRKGTAPAVAVQSNVAFDRPAELIINDCPSFESVFYTGTVDGGWIGRGSYDGPVYSGDADVYLEFSTTAVLINETGSTIAANRLCKTVGASVSLATDGDVVEAVSIKAVADDASAPFIVTRRTDVRNIGLAASATGLVYVNAGVATLVDPGSGHPVGRAKDGLVTFFEQ